VSMLGRKLLRDLWGSRGVLLAIVSIIAVGVACMVTMGSAYWNLSQAKQRYYAQCRMADFWIDLKKAPQAEIQRLSELPGVAALRPRISFYATVGLDEVERPLNGLVLSLPEQPGPVLNDIVLKQGGYFTDRRQNEVIVNHAFARHYDLHPGDWIHLVLNNRRQELFIVGTAISSEFVYLLAPGALVPDPEHFGVFYLKQSYAEDVFDFDGAANQIVGRVAPAYRQRPGALFQRMETLLDDYGVVSVTPLADQASNKYLSQEIQGLKSFGVVMPAMFLVVAAVVLNVLLSRLAEQQRTVMGTLKALGYGDRQLFLHFLQLGLTVGLAGGVVGCALGYWLAGAMTVMYRSFFEFPELDNHFYPGLQAAAVAVSLLCAGLGSLRGAKAILRLKPAEAMRPRPPKQGGAVLIERVGWLWSRLSAGWRMVVRGVVRNRFRTAAGIFAAAMGGSVLVSGLMMAEATTFLLDFQFYRILRSDVELSFKNERDIEALHEAARLPGVDHAEPVLRVAGTFFSDHRSRKGAITGLTPHARLTVPRDAGGRPIRIPAAGLAMTRKLAEVLHVERGQTVRFRPVRGQRRVYELPVVEISDSYLGTSVYADIHYLSRLIGEELAVSGVQLATDRNPEHRREMMRRLKTMPALQAVNTREELVGKLEETLVQNMLIFIGALVLFAGVVFFGSILNSSLVSLAERSREVATLRVLGYGPWQIGSLLLRESLVVTLVGTLLGMPLGYGLTVLAAMAFDSEMFRFPVVWSAATWGWTFVLAMVFALASHLLVQRVIHRFDWLEALQAKE